MIKRKACVATFYFTIIKLNYWKYILIDTFKMSHFKVDVESRVDHLEKMLVQVIDQCKLLQQKNHALETHLELLEKTIMEMKTQVDEIPELDHRIFNLEND